MSSFTRRDFAKTGLVGAGVIASPWSRVLGANDDIRVAIVGCGRKGSRHVLDFQKLDGVRVVALCDPDTAHTAKSAKKLAEQNVKVDEYQDVRKLLEDKNIDAIAIATPNHWHSLAGIWACQAGKDVYCEKPVSHNVFEGRKLVEAARKYDRIVQTGTQNRSDYGKKRAIEWMHEGHLGEIKVIRGFCYKRRPSIGKVDGPQKPPSTLDYDLWCGPAPVKPLMREELHYDWHWVWDTGNGDIGNQGIHEMDIARWALGVDHVSPRIMSIGGRFGYDDDGETPNTQIAYHDYPGKAPIIFEVRGLPMSNKEGYNKTMPHYKGVRIGNVYECENGYISGAKAYDNDGKEIKQFSSDGGGGHQANFIKAVRSHKVEDLNADILEGHLSSALCHTGNIAHRLGQEMSDGEILERIKGNAMASEAYGRFQEHLGANGINVAKLDIAYGPWLEMDPKTERFTGELAKKANRLVSRRYRKPFAVPKTV